jgi:hypothetical protein
MNQCITSALGSGLVSTAARFSNVLTYATRIIPDATASRHLWYAIPLRFLDSVASGLWVLLMNDSLSPNTLTGPSIGTPNHRSLYRKACNFSTAVSNAIYSLPNVDDSTVFCQKSCQSAIGGKVDMS